MLLIFFGFIFCAHYSWKLAASIFPQTGTHGNISPLHLISQDPVMTGHGPVAHHFCPSSENHSCFCAQHILKAEGRRGEGHRHCRNHGNFNRHAFHVSWSCSLSRWTCGHPSQSGALIKRQDSEITHRVLNDFSFLLVHIFRFHRQRIWYANVDLYMAHRGLILLKRLKDTG